MRVFGDLRPKPDTRMLRVVLARHKLPAHRCVLVEDTLANLKSARRLGLRTVWMQHYLQSTTRMDWKPASPLHGRPPWVCVKIKKLTDPAPHGAARQVGDHHTGSWMSDAYSPQAAQATAAAVTPRRCRRSVTDAAQDAPVAAQAPQARRAPRFRSLHALATPCWSNPPPSASRPLCWPAHLTVSEAALYRHFRQQGADVSKGLIAFIEAQPVHARQPDSGARKPIRRSRWPACWRWCLQFAQKEPRHVPRHGG
jgi:hypothetical protein